MLATVIDIRTRRPYVAPAPVPAARALRLVAQTNPHTIPANQRRNLRTERALSLNDRRELACLATVAAMTADGPHEQMREFWLSRADACGLMEPAKETTAAQAYDPRQPAWGAQLLAACREFGRLIRAQFWSLWDVTPRRYHPQHLSGPQL